MEFLNFLAFLDGGFGCFDLEVSLPLRPDVHAQCSLDLEQLAWFEMPYGYCCYFCCTMFCRFLDEGCRELARLSTREACGASC